MLIDQFLPLFQFEEKHEIQIFAPSQSAMEVINHLDPFDDRLTNAMMNLRKFPAQFSSLIRRKPPTPFNFNNFQRLEQNHEEIVFGLIGKFWQLNFGIVDIETPEDYLAYCTPETSKLVMNFHIQEITDHSVILSTETRVFCPDKTSYRKFAPYWYLIRLGSGFIRNKMLRNIKKRAELKNYS